MPDGTPGTPDERSRPMPLPTDEAVHGPFDALARQVHRRPPARAAINGSYRAVEAACVRELLAIARLEP